MTTERILTADELAKHGIYIRPVKAEWDPHVRFYVAKAHGESWLYWNPRPGAGWKDSFADAAGYHVFNDARAAASKIVAEPAELKIEVWWRSPSSPTPYRNPNGPDYIPAPIVRHPDGRVDVKEVVPDEVLKACGLGLGEMDLAGDPDYPVAEAWLANAETVAAKVKGAQ